MFPVNKTSRIHACCRIATPCLLSAAILILSLTAPPARAAIFDFSATYQSVNASFGGGLVTMSVFDEERLQTKTINVSSAATFDISVVNGVVAWSSGSQIYYFVYDPTLGNWVGETGALGPTASDLRTANGVVVWSTTAGTIQYRVYDRQRGAWKAGSAATGATSNLRAIDGTVAWSNSGPAGGAHARVYDPIKGSWQAADVSSIAVNDFIHTNGVVAFTTTTTVPGRVYYYVYDPTRSGWQAGFVASGVPSDLRCFNGVVAWSVNPAVYYAVYDPSRGLWRNSGEPASGYAADLAISNSVVTWTTASSSYARGYDALAGTWGAGPAVRLAYFAVSTNNANAPLLVHFIDMSIGGVSWNWNFGDGFTSALRSPTHRYTNLNMFVATETVAGSFGSASTNKLITTDITPPAGTVVINGGAAFTTNPVVSLALNATDNSGIVATMRFSNTGSSWSGWESYATSKSWTLAAGVGNRTVYVQFADRVTNISASATAGIQLDTTPLPVVSVVSANVPEGAGSAIVSVVLSTNFSRLVSIRYATTNGTATAGLDFMNVAGRLDFAPGATVQTFSIPITQDLFVELNETIVILLSDPTNCIMGAGGVVSIIDDDLPLVSFSRTNYTVSEGSSNAAVTVQLSAAFGQPVMVTVQATNGTAQAGLDFVAGTSVLLIPSGETNATFLVRILDDALDEANETIALRILGATNALLAAPTNAVLTILDDDAPSVGFSRKIYPVFERDGFVMLNIQLSKPVVQQVEFDYLVFGGTATPGPAGDYLPESGHRSFAPGSTNVIVFVTLVDNDLPEPDETAHLSLSNITHADPGPNAEADILIHDDDGPPALHSPRWSNGLFQMTAQGKPGQVFRVQTSSNLTSWGTAFLLTNETGTLEFADPNSPGVPRRFYRTNLP